MWAAGAWTLFVWLTRIPLVEPEAGPEAWIRVAAALAAGLVVLAGAWQFTRWEPRTTAWLNIGFAFAMVFLWLPSLLSVWGNDNSLGFRLVHTLLAGVSMGFGVVLAQRAQDTMRSSEQNVDHVSGEQGRQIDS